MNFVKLYLEFTDSYQSIVDDYKYIDEIELNCKKICDVFEFELETTSKTLENWPNLKMNITVHKHPVFYQNYLNVINAFCQLYSINLCNGVEFEESIDL